MAGCRGVTAQPGSPDARDADQPQQEPDVEQLEPDVAVEAEFDDESDDEAEAREEAAVLEQTAAETVAEPGAETPAEPAAEPAAKTPATGGFDLFTPTHAQEPSPRLVELAKAYGVLTEYHDWQGRHTRVSRRTILAVLRALEVDASTDEAVERALVELDERPGRRILPDGVVLPGGQRAPVPAPAPDGATLQAWVDLEEGGRRVLEREQEDAEPREIDGVLVRKVTFTLPADLPLGWHRLRARHEDGDADRPLVIAPDRLELPEAL